AGIAFFVNSVAKPVAEPAAALAPAAEAVAGAVPSLPLSYLSILRFILAGLGVPLDPLIEGSRKCVTELGPETVGAVKTLLVMWASSLHSSPSLCGYPSPATFTIM
ncbi:Secretoglobin family 3A member 1, partial [Lemmus lemmus]